MALPHTQSKAKQLHDILFNSTNSSGSTFVKIESLMHILGLHHSDVVELIDQLEASGAISAREAHGDGLKMTVRSI